VARSVCVGTGRRMDGWTSSASVSRAGWKEVPGLDPSGRQSVPRLMARTAPPAREVRRAIGSALFKMGCGGGWEGKVIYDGEAANRIAHHLPVAVSQMWEAELRHLQAQSGARALLVRLLARGRQAAVGIYWQNLPSRHLPRDHRPRRGAHSSRSCGRIGGQRKRRRRSPDDALCSCANNGVRADDCL